MDPLILRLTATDAIESIGIMQGIDVSPLTDNISRAHESLNLPHDKLSLEIINSYARLSNPLILNFSTIDALKFYLVGPLFHINARDRWTIDFSTSSGLPDPLEWMGSDWYCRRYSVTQEELTKCGVGNKNPFRPINYGLGICNAQLPCKRLYVLQYSKTAEQVQNAYHIASRAGKGYLYLRDAVIQLIQVFRTPNLKIIFIHDFPEPLWAWTRISQKEVMLSCRPNTSERKISHGLWLKSGFRLSEAAIRGIYSSLSGILIFGASTYNNLATILTIIASSCAVFLTERAIKRQSYQQAGTINKLQDKVSQIFQSIWDERELSCIIKHPERYEHDQVLENACKTLAGFLGDITYEDILEVYKSESGGVTGTIE